MIGFDFVLGWHRQCGTVPVRHTVAGGPAELESPHAMILRNSMH